MADGNFPMDDKSPWSGSAPVKRADHMGNAASGVRKSVCGAFADRHPAGLQRIFRNLNGRFQFIAGDGGR